MSNLTEEARNKLRLKNEKSIALEIKLDRLEKAHMMWSALVVEPNVDLCLYFVGKTKEGEFDQPRSCSTKPVNVGLEMPHAAKKVIEVLLNEIEKQLSALIKEIEAI